MKPARRITGDDVCDAACPSGPPPTCPKMACQRAIEMFTKDIAPPEPAKKPKMKKKSLGRR